MRALKIVVVAMGVLLIVGFAVLIAGIAERVSRRASTAETARPFAAAAIDIPANARIEAMTAAAPNRLVVALALPDGSRQLVVLDLATGARLGTIELRPAR